MVDCTKQSSYEWHYTIENTHKWVEMYIDMLKYFKKKYKEANQLYVSKDLNGNRLKSWTFLKTLKVAS